MRKPKIILLINFSIIIFLILIQVVVSNSLSTTGLNLSSIDKGIEAYKKENILLKEKLLSLSSLTNIASEAARIGFVDDKSSIFVSSVVPIAKAQ